MNIVERLASQQNRRDQKPNIELGREIARTGDIKAINEIRSLLTNKNTSIKVLADLIKSLESVGEVAPDLIADLYPQIITLIDHKKNHIVWRTMCVLALIGPFNRQLVFQDLSRILDIMDQGSVVTRDHGINLLIDLYSQKKYQKDITPLLEEQLLKAPDNQLGQYTEKWMKVIATSDIEKLLKILNGRLPELTNEYHKKRIDKNIRKLVKQISN
tara:strand:+ start:4255 stop:4899 length:645 start_codon:yes stop_codon:yes gene_type:complete